MATAPVLASAQSMQLWSAFRDFGSASDVAVRSQTDASGNTYMLAQTPRSSGPDVVFCRFNNAGAISFTRPLTNAGPDYGDAMTLTPSGGACFSYSFFNNTAKIANEYVRRYDSHGNVVFSYGPVQTGFRASCMAAGSDNSVYVAGTINAGLRVFHLSSGGALLWSTDVAPTDQNGSDSAAGIAVDSNGNTTVAGALWNGTATLPGLWQLDSNGNLILGETIHVAGQDSGAASAMLIDPKGPILVAGTSSLSGLSRGWLACFDSIGNQSWAQTTVGSGFLGETLSAIALDPFERVIVAGTAMTSATNQDMYIARFAVDSTPIWSATFDGPGGGPDAASWISVDQWGSIYIGGNAQNGAGREDYAILKLSPTGVPIWPSSGDVFYNGAAIFDGDGSANNMPCGLGLDAVGKAYIAGSSIGLNGGYDGNVVKYGLTDNAAFVSQTVPTSMVAGWQYPATVSMQNSGNTVWTNTADYRLGSQNPTDNGNWGFNRVSIPFGDSISNGQSENFNFTVTAPINAGTYNFQWRMHNSLGYFGAQSSNVPISVTELPDAAAYVSQSVPTSVKAGSTFTVTVNMRNVGSNGWTSSGYSLVPVPGYANWVSSGTSLSSTETVPHGATKTFTITCVAPMKTGSYKMKWQMSGPNGVFDQVTSSKGIGVTS